MSYIGRAVGEHKIRPYARRDSMISPTNIVMLSEAKHLTEDQCDPARCFTEHALPFDTAQGSSAVEGFSMT